MQDLTALRDKSIRKLEDALQLSGGEPPIVRPLNGAEVIRIGLETMPVLHKELAPLFTTLDLTFPDKPFRALIPKSLRGEHTILGRIAAYDASSLVNLYVDTVTGLMQRYEQIFARITDHQARKIAGTFYEFSNTILVRDVPEPFLQEKMHHELTHWLSARANPEAFSARAKLSMLAGSDARVENGAYIHCIGEGIAMYTAGKLLEQEFSRCDLDVVNLQAVRQSTTALRDRLRSRAKTYKHIPRVKSEDVDALIGTIFCLRHSHELGHDYVQTACKNKDWRVQIRDLILDPQQHMKEFEQFLLYK